MNIALDVMGGDHGPGEIIAGAIEAAQTYKITVSLVGPPDIIRSELAKHATATAGLRLPIVPASQVIEMGEKPAAAVRAKQDSSIVVASRMVRNGEAQGFVTAGNTGGALAAGIFQVGRIEGILRPALITPFPTHRGFCVILDVGANADVKPEHLQQFAIMGSVYARHVMGVNNPRVRILSNGEEEGKGNQLVISAYNLLAATPGINFQGNVESKEIVEGMADVVVTDGFTGNVFVKTAEATAKLLQRVMLEELTAGPISSVGAFLAQAALRRLRTRMDDSQYGGAVLLGLAGMVVVAHGRSKANAIRHAIRVAKQGAEQNIQAKIQEGVAESAPRASRLGDSAMKAVPT
ncbi:MAG: phosphate acyltransferase PlsX [Caldilineaceae bacterium]|nr:phosphate acyltransferase PlsX [Caldilineaceae bacterium]